ncbi:uncharacterized protein LOC134269695, partial [Saccostrea cucullata]|uniref:uncharacterized protein LOC134269695 n=1 Tax=Saccostrea cuccullata TaxID=36930 RepID=UPI002ED12C33
MRSWLESQTSFRVPGVSRGNHISHVSSDRVWISDNKNLVLTNTAGNEIDRVTDITKYGDGVHTVTSDGDLIYIDRKGNITKLSKDDTVKSLLIPNNTAPWRRLCVYSFPFTGDLLVGMCNDNPVTGHINRYTNTGRHIQTIQHNNKGQELYRYPRYITENHNGDVVVSDMDGDHGSVVVTDSEGRYRFSYTGPPSGSGLRPYGICTDALSHILLYDYNTDTVQILDRDGRFLSQTGTLQRAIETVNGLRKWPFSLSYDYSTHLLWVGSKKNNKVNIYSLIYKVSMTDLPLDNLECEKHPSGTLSQFCILCEAALCEICIMTSTDHKKHDVRDVEKLFREIHKRK